MASSAQINANHLNSQKSTGPKSPDGKKRSSLNAMRHGFTGQLLVVPEAESAIYQKHCHEYHAEFTPKGKLETDLVQEIADLRWSIDRIRAHESNLFAIEAVSTRGGLDSGDPDINSALAIADSLRDNVKVLATLSIYEQRKLRAFEKTLDRLRELQKERKHEERVALAQAADHREVFQDKRKEQWHPDQDGFVCSNEEIDSYVERRDRRNIVRNALRPKSKADQPGKN